MSPQQTSKLNHLQGLRGIAILAVVLFHFFPKQFTNGYLGVDVFFLLSAYLMTMMFSRHDVVNLPAVLDFWYRRVKRIAPLYYLVIVIILVLLNFTESSLQSTNSNSATTAALFATNLVRPTGLEGYFEKLGVAVDMFTHTWSLAVEMQFYLVFPIIFIAWKSFSEDRSMMFVNAITLLSFTFYLFSDSFTSFNSVFSRIWQFNAGMMSFLYSKEQLFSKGENDPLITLNLGQPATIQYCLGATFMLLFYPSQVTVHFARMLITMLTMVILQIGHESTVLKFQPFLFVGEVSYSWYLIHWPIVAYVRLIYRDSFLAQFSAMVASFLMAIVIHTSFEQMYIKWNKTQAITFLVILVLTVSGQLYLFKSDQPKIVPKETYNPLAVNVKLAPMGKDNYPSDFIGTLVFGYENKTIDERIRLNDINDGSDIDRTFTSFCKNMKKVSNPTEHRCEMNEGANTTSNYKLLVVGNSYASNIMPVLAEECRDNFKHLEISTMGGCESLVHSEDNYYDCSYDAFHVDAVKKVKPDVLFVINRLVKQEIATNKLFRHINMMDIKNGTNPFDDEHFKTASDRLTEMQKHVSRRIFILDAFPEVSNANIRLTNARLKNNDTIDDTKMVTMTQKFLTARLRLARLVEKCPKCRMFDFSSQFFINGHFKTYDPKYFVSFFTKGFHLTPPGWERVRPLIRHLCESF